MRTFVPDAPPPSGVAEPKAEPKADRERVNLWLRLTSTGWQSRSGTIKQRDAARRSRLTSWIILGLLVADLALLPAGFDDAPTLIAILAFGGGLVLAAVLNRLGQTNASGILIVLLIDAGVLGALLSASHGLELVYLPAYDLLAIAAVVGASVLPRVATFPVAALGIGLIVVDYLAQPHAPDLARAEAQNGVLGLLARPIALQVIIAVVAYLWVRGVDEAIRRADRAEEFAALEHSIAEQKRQLDLGIQQLLQTHVRAANGDFGARAPLRQDNVLWQIGSSLNNLLARMQRAAQAEHQLARTTDELRRLAAAIDDAQAGRQPLWPAPTGTPADLILERVARGPRRRPVPTAPYDQALPPGHAPLQGGQTPASMGWPSLSSQPLAPSPYAPSSQPLGHPPYAPHAPSSQPLSQSPYAPTQGGHPGHPPQAPRAPQAPDSWQMPDRVDDAHALPNPWILPAEQPEQPERPLP